jgi:peroxiredoxin
MPAVADRRGAGDWRRWLVPAVAAALVIGAVAVVGAAHGGQSGTEAGPAAAGGGVVVERAGGSQVGEQVAALHAGTTAGTRFTLPAGRPAVVFFMAVGCTGEVAPLDRIEREFGGRVAVLGVDPDPGDTFDSLAALADQAGIRYGLVHDRDGALTAALAARSLDTTVVLDAAGRIVYRDTVPTDESGLRAALSKAGLA